MAIKKGEQSAGIGDQSIKYWGMCGVINYPSSSAFIGLA